MFAIVAIVLSVASAVYTYYTMRKMQKKNRPEPNQMDGSLADEGVSFSSIFGSPHIHGNIVWKGNESTEAITQKTKGFLGIGGSKQTVGYKYFAGLQVAIGNCIEQILNINPDNRGWIFTTKAELDLLKVGDVSMPVNKPNLFGGEKQEGGWFGAIDIHTGKPEKLRQNEYLAKHDSELVSSFPCLSHLVFRGADLTVFGDGETGLAPSLNKGFYLCAMSGVMKEVLYWPKRTRIKDDGSEQWYKSYINENGDEIIVCEVEAIIVNDPPVTVDPTPAGLCTFNYIYTSGCNLSTPPITRTWTKTYNSVELDPNPDAPYPKGQVIPCPAGYGPSAGCVWNSQDKKTGHYEFNLEFGGMGRAVISFDFRVPYSEIYDFEPVVDFQCSHKYEIIKNDDKWTYIVKEDAPCTIRAIWDVESAWFENPQTPEFNWYYAYGLSFIYYHQESASGDVDLSYRLDINPIHKIREIITDDTAMNKPESMINDANFKAAARRIWDEKLGVSGAFTEKSCKEAIDELLYHIEAGIRLNRQTGQYEIVLFRDDLLNLSTAQVFNKSNIKSFNIEIANADDLVNSVNVNFYDRENIKDSSFSLDEIGSLMSSEVNTQTLDFPYFMTHRNAELVGNWKLKQLSTATRKGSFTTGKYEARKINRYDVIKLTWENQNLYYLPVRVMKISLGDGRDNTVTIDWVEVIPYSNIEYPRINIDPPTNTVLPPQPNLNTVFEMPYYEAVQRFGQTQVDLELSNNPDLGYLMTAAKKPQNNSINALLYTNSSTSYKQVSVVDYCSTAVLDQNISYLDTTFAVKDADVSKAEIGTLIICNDEIMVYQNYDDDTKILTVKRAALDTVPKPHSQDAVFYFYDDYSAFDSEQYVLSESIDAKVLTTTPSGIQDFAETHATTLEINARPIRPYPPANIKINGEYYPDEIETDLVVTWVDRNRLQQTGGSILGWTDGGVTLESGATTILIIKELDAGDVVIATHNINATGTNTYTLAVSAMQVETRSIEVTAKTVRDGYESYQYFEHTVEPSFFSAPYNIQYEVREV